MAGERALPGLGLKAFWTLGSNGYKPQLDEDIQTLSVLTQAAVKMFIPFLPGSPTNGDIYVLNAGADINKIGFRDNGAWVMLTPKGGWLVWSEADAKMFVFDGTNWGELDAAPRLPILAGAGDANKTLKANGAGTSYALVTVPNLPGLAGVGDAGKAVRANAAGTGFELFIPLNLPAFTVGDALKVVRVNAGETAYELAAPSGGGATTFVALTDTPADYTGMGLQYARVNVGETALEFATIPTPPAFNVVVKTASYASVSADFAGNRLIRMNLAGANTFTVDPSMANGEPLAVSQMGAGQTTIVAGSGVTLVSAGGALKLRTQYSACTVMKVGTNSYLVSGDLTT